MLYFYLKVFCVQKHLLLLAITLMMSGHINAQEAADDKTVLITFAPLAMADLFDGPSLRLGAETRFRKDLSAALEGGPYLDYLNSTKINPRGFLIRPSLKYHLDKTGKGKFIAVEYQYKQQQFGFVDSIVMPDAQRIEKQYNMKRTIHSIVAKYGNMAPLGKKFLLEWYFGMGIRHIRSHNDLTPEENDGILTGEAGDCPIQEDIIRLIGTRIFPDFRAGIKIGYQIRL